MFQRRRGMVKITSPSPDIKIYLLPRGCIKNLKRRLSYRLEKNLSLHYKPLLRSIFYFSVRTKRNVSSKNLEISDEFSHASIPRPSSSCAHDFATWTLQRGSEGVGVGLRVEIPRPRFRFLSPLLGYWPRYR